MSAYIQRKRGGETAYLPNGTRIEIDRKFIHIFNRANEQIGVFRQRAVAGWWVQP